jgi:hypothetical protein
VVDYGINIGIYLRYFGSSMSTGFVCLSIEDNTEPVRMMLSVRDTAIAAQKVSPEFEQCSCSMPLVLSKTVLFLCDQVADIRPRQTSGVVVTLTGNSLEDTHSLNRTHMVTVLRFQEFHEVQCDVLIVCGW